jgi:quinol-cytochrome oxidoreductase complex cytochrome b subunit
MLACVLLTIVGFCIVIATTPWAAHFQSLHGILGMLMVVLTLVQFILGIAIDKLFDASRVSIPIRDKVHWFLGVFVTLLSIAVMVLGHLIYGTDGGLFALHLVVILLWVIAFCVAQIKIGQTHDPAQGKESASAEIGAP